MDYEKKIRDYMNSSEVDQLYKSMLSNLFPELVEPKEEKARRSLLEFLEDLFKLGKNINFDRWSKADCEEWVNWVMKQGEQKPAEWTAEDEEELKIALNTLEEAGQFISAKWLKNVCLVPQTMQKPTEWSEEVESAIQLLEDIADEQEKDSCPYNANDLRIASQYLKSLRPQNTLKPSDLPHWKKSNLPDDNSTGFNSDYFCYKGYNINYKELFEKLPKDD